MASGTIHMGREHSLLQALRRDRSRLVPVPDHVLVGYSGGGDSLALLVMLNSLAGHAGFRLSAVHVNHGVRSGSDDDADLVTRVCATLGIPLVVHRIDQARLAAHLGGGLEEALRRERYRSFASALVDMQADVLALAHHQRDQAETVLMHLMRGAGLAGASGMRPIVEITVPWWNVEPDVSPVCLRIWRPLLGIAFDDLRAIATASGLPIAEDPSNQDESFRRNAIRHSVLPLLEQVAPGATASIARFGNLAAIDDEELDAQAGRALESILKRNDIDRHGLQALPAALQPRVVRRWITGQAPIGLEVTRERVDAVLVVAAKPGPGRVVELGHGTSVEVTRHRLRVVIHPLT